MKGLLFDTLPLDLLINKSKYYLNKKYEYYFSKMPDNIRKTFNGTAFSSIESKSKNLEIKDLPISWYCLNVLQSLSMEKPREDRIHFIKNVFKQTDLGDNDIDFLTYDFSSNEFRYKIPINLNKKLNLNFGSISTLESIQEYEKWEIEFIKALEIVRSINPKLIRNLNLLVKNILVTKSSEGSHSSMSPKSIVGTIYLPDVKDSTLIAECFIHECLHQYLYRIEFAGSLFNNNDGTDELYYSPWKDEPRPLIMVLHGAFVFTGVILYYFELYKKKLPKKHLIKFKNRMVFRNGQVRIALKVLLHTKKNTDLGKKIIETLEDKLLEINNSNVFAGDNEIDSVLDHFNKFCSKNFKHVSIK